MEFKRSVLGAVLIGAAAFSGNAMAGVTGNVGAVSEYMFRGISQGSGAAIQGGIDYSHDSGFYAGTWFSNIDWFPAGSVEADFYAGFTKSFDNGLGFDVGAIYYYYPETDQADLEGAADSPNTVEVYAGLTYSYFSLKYYYSPKYFGAKVDGDDVNESYIVLSGAFPLSDSLKATASIGYTSLSDPWVYDGPDGAFNVDPDSAGTDEYIDWSVGLSKAIDETLTATFAVIGTDLEKDDPKVQVGIKKTFSF